MFHLSPLPKLSHISQTLRGQVVFLTPLLTVVLRQYFGELQKVYLSHIKRER